jgi:hypothetical protein
MISGFVANCVMQAVRSNLYDSRPTFLRRVRATGVRRVAKSLPGSPLGPTRRGAQNRAMLYIGAKFGRRGDRSSGVEKVEWAVHGRDAIGAPAVSGVRVRVLHPHHHPLRYSRSAAPWPLCCGGSFASISLRVTFVSSEGRCSWYYSRREKARRLLQHHVVELHHARASWWA